MKTGRAAGMLAVGALWGFRTAEELLANGADVLIASPEELLGLL
jgi:phosphoglycolate phosphatase